MRLRSGPGAPKEWWAGWVFVAIGIIALLQAKNYAIRTLTAMGPGYFPLMLSGLLIALGLASAIKGWMKSGDAMGGRWPLVPLLFLLIGIAIFAGTIEAWGLIPAVFGLVVMICYRDLRAKPVQVVASALLLAAGTAIVFVYLLGMPIKAY